MKKLILTLAISASLYSPLTLSETAKMPTAIAIFEHNGKYSVSGFDSGSKYAWNQTVALKSHSEERIANLTVTGEERRIAIETINQEQKASIEKAIVRGKYADKVIEYASSGMALNVAESKAAEEILMKYVPSVTKTGSYNEGSVTSAAIEGESVPTVNNNLFKTFNELDCTYDEVSNYIDKSHDKKTKSYSTSPSYSDGFKLTASKAEVEIKGEEAAECQTIFHDINYKKLEEPNISDLNSGLPTFGDFGDMMGNLGNKAGEQLNNLATDLYGVLKEGLCERASKEYVGELVGDVVDDEVKEQMKGSPLSGTKISSLDTKSGQNNFTYKIIKNQTGQSNSNLIKSMDVTRDDQAKYQDKYLSNELDDLLDDLEDDLFN